MSTMTLPSVDQTPQQKQQRTLKPGPPPASVTKIDIDRPADIPTGYVRRRVDVKMPHKHSLILHKKLRELQDVGARLADGTEVSDHTKAVLWILENEVE